MELIDAVEKWIDILYRIILVGIFIAFLIWILYSFLTLRKRKILFQAWINRFDESEKDLGKSMGDLLLLELQTIKTTHDRSSRILSLWNPYQDIPSFKQALDKEVELIGSIELGNYGKLINTIAALLFKAAPLVIKPAVLQGSINTYGDSKTLLMITLTNYRLRERVFWRKNELTNLVWKIEKDNVKKEDIPKLIEEIAYRIYIDLTGTDLFRSWKCFRQYTKGMQHYIRYTELPRDSDLLEAERYYDQALKLEMNNPVVCYNKGVMRYFAYRESENLEAIDLFKRALNSSDSQLQVRARTGLANGLTMMYHRFNLREIKLLEEAILHGEECLRLNTKLDSVHKCIGFAYHQRSESMSVDEMSQKTVFRNKAIFHYKKACQLNNQHYIAHNNLGNLYLGMATESVDNKNTYLNEAIREFKKSLSINPRYFHAYDNLGNSYIRLNQFNDAIECFSNALLYNAKYAEAKNDLAITYLNPQFERRNDEMAFKFHLEAVELCSSETQKEKVINQFNGYRSQLIKQ